MMHPRLIPCLLLQRGGLVKTVRFKDPTYIGDPINAVKIFTEKMTDELIFLDIDASRVKRGPDYRLIEDIINEAFMPFTYGGGITKVGEIERLLNMGIEKVSINSAVYDDQKLISEGARIAGSSSIVVSIDVRRGMFGKPVLYSKGGTYRQDVSMLDHVRRVVDLGAGEILLNSIDRDGMMTGYDLELVHEISAAASVPVIACGGASSLKDAARALDAGASAAAAGSMFVYFGKMKGILINYPTYDQIEKEMGGIQERMSS